MLMFGSAVCLMAGVAILAQAIRSDRAVLRWTHTRGRIVSAARSHLDDAGREVWQVQVSWTDDSGANHSRNVRQLGSNVDQRRGETADVWYDPHHPDRADARLDGNAAGSSWPAYGLGGLLTVAAGLMLLATLR